MPRSVTGEEITKEDVEQIKRHQLVTSLEGKTIKEAELREGRDEFLVITFEDGTQLTAGAFSGAGADSNWHAWTSVGINGKSVINK